MTFAIEMISSVVVCFWPFLYQLYQAVSVILTLDLGIDVTGSDAVWSTLSCEVDSSGISICTIINIGNHSDARRIKHTCIKDYVVAGTDWSPTAMPECSACIAVLQQIVNCPLVLVGKKEY